jgi:hypothetical protein
MSGQPIAISFCTTCKGRLYQLRETLPQNLAALGADEEIVLVDYHSPDGLAAWVWDNFEPEIAAGRLRFFEVLDEAPWHMAKAKNLAHRLARGPLLFNLDADNFLTAQDLQHIRAAVAQGLCCRQGTGNIRDGTPGRIGLPREAFHRIGGYDEALLGVLLDDYDLIVRAEAAGHRFLRLPPPERLPLQNDVGERLGQFVATRSATEGDLAAMGRINVALSKLRLELEGPLRKQNFSTYRGRLDGETVILDGLGNCTPCG